MTATLVGLLFFIVFVAANLPWISQRFFLFVEPRNGKKFWMSLLEWLVLYLVVGAVTLGFEVKVMGSRHAQDWEFYVVTLCIFAVFALPAFVYRYQIRHFLERQQQH